jgi:transcriptional regulator with XRE-family HTH domain
MRDKRDSNGLTIQEAAAEAGVSAATFSRVARGHLPNLENLLLLAKWVGVAYVQLPVNEAAMDESEQPKTVIHGPNETTLESVALHLHADEHLKPEDVDLLMKVLREQYTFLRKRNQEVAAG